MAFKLGKFFFFLEVNLFYVLPPLSEVAINGHEDNMSFMMEPRLVV